MANITRHNRDLEATIEFRQNHDDIGRDLVKVSTLDGNVTKFVTVKEADEIQWGRTLVYTIVNDRCIIRGFAD